MRRDCEYLVNRLKNKDLSALKELIQKYSGALIHFGHLKFPGIQQEIILDSINGAFLCILDSIDTFEYKNEGSFWKWAYRILSNIIISELRASNALKRGGSEQVLSIEELNKIGIEPLSPDIAEIRAEQHDLLDKIFKELPEDYRLVLLYYSRGMTDKEIAIIFGKTVNAAKSLRRRAIEKARHVMNSFNL